jgi:hypothetical protein
LKKQSQFLKGQKGISSVLTITYDDFYDLTPTENKVIQNQCAGHWPEILSTKLEILKELKGNLKKQSQFAKLAQKVQNKHHQMLIYKVIIEYQRNRIERW